MSIETYEISCSSCLPFFAYGPYRPDCGRCQGTGRVTETTYEVTYRVVTKTTYEVTASIDHDDHTELIDHMMNWHTWGDPTPPSIDADVEYIEIRVGGEWQSVTRELDRQSMEFGWTLDGRVGDADGQVANILKASALAEAKGGAA